MQAEQNFVASQLRRRTLQQSLFEVQRKRNDLSRQLDVVSRADESFLSLVGKDHQVGATMFFPVFCAHYLQKSCF